MTTTNDYVESGSWEYVVDCWSGLFAGRETVPERRLLRGFLEWIGGLRAASTLSEQSPHSDVACFAEPRVCKKKIAARTLQSAKITTRVELHCPLTSTHLKAARGENPTVRRRGKEKG
jgi:hypothetical protein